MLIMQSKMNNNRDSGLPLGMKISQIASRTDRPERHVKNSIKSSNTEFEEDNFKENLVKCNSTNLSIKECTNQMSSRIKSTNQTISKICSQLKENPLLSQNLLGTSMNKNRMTRKSITYRDLMAPSNPKFENFENFVRLYGRASTFNKNSDIVDNTKPKIEPEEDSSQFHFTPRITDVNHFSFNLFDNDVNMKSNKYEERNEEDDRLRIIKNEDVGFSSYFGGTRLPVENKVINPWHSSVKVNQYDDDSRDETSDLWNHSISSQELSFVSDNYEGSRKFVDENPYSNSPPTQDTTISEILSSGSEVVFGGWNNNLPLNKTKSGMNNTTKESDCYTLCPFVSYQQLDGTLIIEEIPANE